MSDPLAHRVAEHVAKLTGERRRPRLELLLLEALCDIGRARRTDYYRLQVAPGETLCWKAASCLNGHSTVFDDGINVPQDLLSLAAMPDAARAVGGGHAVIVGDGSARRMIWPISAAGSSAGFVILESARDASRPLAPFEDPLEQPVLAALTRVFRNVMDLLDYSEVDTLTNLFNRKTFDEHLMQVLASLDADDDDALAEGRELPRRRHSLAGASHWLAVMDIDHFKRINDTFGHLIGDEVLLMVANLMRASFRFRDRLFRFGGEEFIAVLKPATAVQVQTVFDRFRRTIERHEFPQVGSITLSIGYAPLRLGNQPSVIIHQADQALYWAKENGRNRVASYEQLVSEGRIAAYLPPASDIELF